jgi:hypothetical protein
MTSRVSLVEEQARRLVGSVWEPGISPWNWEVLQRGKSPSASIVKALVP